MEAQRVTVAPRNYPEYCSLLGLHTPFRRAMLAASVTGLVGLAVQQPGFMFHAGKPRPFKPLAPDDEEAETMHFFLVPLTVGVAAYIFS